MWPRSAHGWHFDLALYAGSAVFALFTALYSTFAPHRLWGSVAVWGYLTAAVISALALIMRRVRPPETQAAGTMNSGSARRGSVASLLHSSGQLRLNSGSARRGPLRAIVAGGTIVTTMLLPLLIEAVQRATGSDGRAQEEVPVIEAAGRRLIDLGTPYLDRDTIAGLPESLRLLAYLPYQPAMALLGVPHALRPTDWWADARMMFLVVSTAAIACAFVALRLSPTHPNGLLALQSVTLPLCALTLATGGDDVPVLALCLLSLALCASGHAGPSGVIIGAAGCLKLIALPVAAVIGAFILVRRRREALPYALGAFGLPLLALVPSLLLNVDSVVENVLRFPLGHALVTSPAGSPLPGYLIATHLAGGRRIAIGLLIAAMVVIAVALLRRPPRTLAQAAVVSGVALLIAILLLPATRFGYLMYPVALLAWAPALRSGEVVLARGVSERSERAPKGALSDADD